MRIKGSDLIVARVLHEDDDRLTIEVGKRDDVTFTLDPETPDQFYTLLFVRRSAGGVEIWRPWEDHG